jgi:Serine carboxypeptidase
MLFFNGVNDLICNHVGNEIAVENFQWKHQKEFQTAKRYGWKPPSKGQLGGYIREYKNLMFLKVLDSGHMVPMDVPDVGLDMMRNLVYGSSFGDYEQVLDASMKGKGRGDCPVCPAKAECKSCPICPAASKANTTDSEFASSTKGELSPNTFTIPFSKKQGFVGSAIVAAVVALCICGMYGCLFPRKKRATTHFDMELAASSSTYTDKPEQSGEFS